MENTIAPITAGQIGRAADRFMEKCRINALSLPKDATQGVLEDEGDALAKEMFEVFRARVERRAKTIVLHAKINHDRTLQQVLDAAGNNQVVGSFVINSMPKSEGDEVDIFFFNMGDYVDVDHEMLEKEYEDRGFKPAPPLAFCAVNEANPDFAKKYPNITHWKDPNGKWLKLSGRGVICSSEWFDHSPFSKGVWFAGVKK